MSRKKTENPKPKAASLPPGMMLSQPLVTSYGVEYLNTPSGLVIIQPSGNMVHVPFVRAVAVEVDAKRDAIALERFLPTMVEIIQLAQALGKALRDADL